MLGHRAHETTSDPEPSRGFAGRRCSRLQGRREHPRRSRGRRGTAVVRMVTGGPSERPPVVGRILAASYGLVQDVTLAPVCAPSAS